MADDGKITKILEGSTMIRNSARFSLLIITTSLFASSLSAQSANPFHQAGEHDIRSSISLTIPLGGQREAAASKPQLSLVLQQNRHQQDRYNFVPNNADFESRTYNLQPQQVRIGFTLNQNSQLMINGKPYTPPSQTANADTLEKVGIGAAVIGGVVVVALGALVIATATSDPAE